MSSSIARLCDAARHGNVKATQTLLDGGLQQLINETDQTGLAPLHLATKQENFELTELLLDYGADPDVKDNSQSTPLNYAAKGKNELIARLLLDNWADLSNKNDSGSTPLHDAVRQGNIAIVKLFAKFDADGNAEDNDGNTPLHIAMDLNNVEMQQVLLGHDTLYNVTTLQVAPKPVFPIEINGNLLDESISPAPDALMTDYILVQTKAMLDPSERRDLATAGLHILEYVSRNTYLCNYEELALANIHRLEPVVYVDVYRRELKIAPDLQEMSMDVEVDVIFHSDILSASPELQVSIIQNSGLSLEDVQFYPHKCRLTVESTRLEEIAGIEQVRSIERVGDTEFCNDNARQILACGNLPSPLSAGSCTFQGKGQIITIADSGLDTGDPRTVHHAFGNRVVDIIAINGSKKDVSGHGTHVCGSAVGDGKMNNQSIKGTAPQANLLVQSISSRKPHRLQTPGDLAQLFGPPYISYASRVHSNSWSRRNLGKMDYTSASEEIDKFVWQHPDMVICFSAGNKASYDKNGQVEYGQIGGTSAAKNCITVGATESERPTPIVKWGDKKKSYPKPISDEHIATDRSRVAAFSSRGTSFLQNGTTKARLKPDLVAPGTHILSAKSSAQQGPQHWWSDSNDPAWCYKSGTSMSTPLVAGCAAVLREVLSHHGLADPSAALIKALLINGAEAMPPPFTSPGLDSGFGRVNLTNSIAAASNQPGTGRGENQLSDGNKQFSETTRVEDNHTSLKATLVWSDPPGNILQNHLKLQIVDPAGSPPLAISKNNVQQIVHKWKSRPSRDITLRVKVIGNLTRSPQPFAVVWSKS